MKIGNHIYQKGLFLVFSLFLISITSPSAYAIDNCVDCHKNDNFRVQNKMLYDYYRNWKDSSHDLSGVTCIDCHGGNPQKIDMKSAHGDSFTSLDVSEADSYGKIPEVCGKCHDPEFNHFKQSKHYKALLDKGTGPHCVTCHGSMNAAVYYTSMIAMTCKNCHNEYTGNHPQVVGEADKILHRINVSRSFKNWVTLHYSDIEPEQVKVITQLYNEIAASWHTFDFVQLDEKSEDLLQRLKALVNRALAHKRKKDG
jgi:formate-dependent nitrite reductase cytochrome c552 subunit